MVQDTVRFSSDFSSIDAVIDISETDGNRLENISIDYRQVIDDIFEKSKIAVDSHVNVATRLLEANGNSAFISLELSFTTKDGVVQKQIVNLEPEEYSKYLLWDVPAIQSLDVLYIGQSDGIKYASNSTVRLKKHPRLIEALEQVHFHRVSDVVIAYLNFEARHDGGRQIPMPSKNIIDLLEGSIINYFKPPLNVRDVAKYPEASNVRSHAVDLGLKHMSVILGSPDSSYRLGTTISEGRNCHEFHYEFDQIGVATPKEIPFPFLSPSRYGSTQIFRRQFSPRLPLRKAEATFNSMVTSPGVLGQDTEFQKAKQKIASSAVTLPYEFGEAQPSLTQPRSYVYLLGGGRTAASDGVISGLRQILQSTVEKCLKAYVPIYKSGLKGHAFNENKRNFLVDAVGRLEVVTSILYPEFRPLLIKCVQDCIGQNPQSEKMFGTLHDFVEIARNSKNLGSELVSEKLRGLLRVKGVTATVQASEALVDCCASILDGLNTLKATDTARVDVTRKVALSKYDLPEDTYQPSLSLNDLPDSNTPLTPRP